MEIKEVCSWFFREGNTSHYRHSKIQFLTNPYLSHKHIVSSKFRNSYYRNLVKNQLLSENNPYITWKKNCPFIVMNRHNLDISIALPFSKITDVSVAQTLVFRRRKKKKKKHSINFLIISSVCFFNNYARFNFWYSNRKLYLSLSLKHVFKQCKWLRDTCM